MRIAIVGASPIPYTRGGIETFLNGLFQTINQHTRHSAELIKIPIREDTTLRLLHAYWRFSRLKLNHFDIVISVKYPAWMIRHDNHILYLGHRLRGLYDTCPFDPAKERVFRGNPLRFPGPLIRRIIHYLDAKAFSPGRISHVYCTSKTIASRTSYFHPEMPPKVVYHSTAIEDYRCGGFDYFFTVSRLDSPKRIDLLIKAYRHVQADVPLIIAGSGPQAAYLKQLSADDPRIRFEGEVSDARLRQLYSDALCVLYVPHSEDYGLITIEAMKSRKPVITAADSGGPLEFVQDGVNGLICEPQELSLAQAMQRLRDDPAEARRMGENGFQTVRNITWTHAVETILAPYWHWPDHVPGGPADRRRLVVFVPYPVYPVRSGGQLRVASLYKKLAQTYDVYLISFGKYGQEPRSETIQPFLHEITVPPTSRHAERQWRMEKEAGVEISDVALPGLIRETPNFQRIARYFCSIADIIISSHPYLHGVILRTPRCKLIIHESHNHEYFLKKKVLETTSTGRKLLAAVRKAEAAAVRRSDLVMSTCRSEADELSKTYGRRDGRFVIVPNGVDTDRIQTADPVRRAEARRKFNLNDETAILFIGAWHPPNLDAFLFIKDVLLKALPGMKFIVIGSVRQNYEARFGPLEPLHNLIVPGEVDEDLKTDALAAADIAINPMFSGSGTNLKILEYFASGTPVVSTPVGIRGLQVRDGESVAVADRDNFAARLESLARDPALRISLAINARRIAEQFYRWDTIGAGLIQAIESLIPCPSAGRIDLKNDQLFLNGWHPLEFWPEPAGGELAVRWTHPEAQLLIPLLRSPETLMLRASGKKEGSSLSVLFDGQTVFKGRISEGWQEVRIPLPMKYGFDYSLVQIQADRWSPFESGSDDRRVLGIAVSGIVVEAADD